MTEEQRSLNNWLRESYGKTVSGKTRFRLVWSEDITEKRKGEFSEFYGKIFLRSVVGIRELKKYNYINNRFILEIWVDNDLSSNGEVPEAKNGDYAPLYVFEDGKGQPLPINHKILTFLIAAVEKKVRKDNEVSEKEAEEKEIQAQYESMDDHPADFRTFGEARNAVAYNKGLKENNVL